MRAPRSLRSTMVRRSAASPTPAATARPWWPSSLPPAAMPRASRCRRCWRRPRSTRRCTACSCCKTPTSSAPACRCGSARCACMRRARPSPAPCSGSTARPNARSPPPSCCSAPTAPWWRSPKRALPVGRRSTGGRGMCFSAPCRCGFRAAATSTCARRSTARCRRCRRSPSRPRTGCCCWPSSARSLIARMLNFAGEAPASLGQLVERGALAAASVPLAAALLNAWRRPASPPRATASGPSPRQSGLPEADVILQTLCADHPARSGELVMAARVMAGLAGRAAIRPADRLRGGAGRAVRDRVASGRSRHRADAHRRRARRRRGRRPAAGAAGRARRRSR